MELVFALFMLSFSWSSEIGLMVDKVEEINTLREALVESGVQPGQIDLKTFKAVCGPVGKRVKSIAEKNNWVFRQVSHKNRNPKNKTNKIEVSAIRKFEKDKNLKSFWITRGEVEHYFRRIDVQKNCLSCHGVKSARPTFVKAKYLKDKAFGFKEGDLRGLYHVYKK